MYVCVCIDLCLHVCVCMCMYRFLFICVFMSVSIYKLYFMLISPRNCIEVIFLTKYYSKTLDIIFF